MLGMGYDMKRLGNAIEDRRRELKITQAELAAAAGVGRTTIVNLETGRDSLRWPRSIADVERALGWPAGRARAIASGQFDPSSNVVPLPVTPVGPLDSADDEFIRDLRKMNIDEDLREVLIYSYRHEKARKDQELRERYLKLARAADS